MRSRVRGGRALRPHGAIAAETLPAVPTRFGGVGYSRYVFMRRRIAGVLGVLTLGVVLGAVLFLDLFSPVAGGAAGTVEFRTVRVGTGETLTDVASRAAPGADIRSVVAGIKRENGLRDAAVVPGQPLRVPVPR